jgi:hypothetical protein
MDRPEASPEAVEKRKIFVVLGIERRFPRRLVHSLVITMLLIKAFIYL